VERQRGSDRSGETEKRDTGGETYLGWMEKDRGEQIERKRQREEAEVTRQRGRDIGEIHRRRDRGEHARE
jgi:hypothetical protein